MPRHALALFPILIVLGSCRPPAAPDPRPEAAELHRAVALALAATVEQREPPEAYRLTGAEQLLLDGAYVWRVTFKPEHLLPDDPSTGKLGAGGEVFVNVDLSTEATTVGYGE